MHAITANDHQRIYNCHRLSSRSSRRVLSLLLFISSNICQTASAENYDFIIAGGGTAGLVVARRLAEGGKHSVLVVESGGMPKVGMDVPAFVSRFVQNPELTFRYPTTPQLHSNLINNGIITEFPGRVLGGTSMLNSMVFNRGNPKDWDHWGNLTHDSSWNYSNMLKYFKRVETYSGEFPSDQHGFSGLISVSQPHYSPGLNEWLAAGQYLGYPIADSNGPQKVSFAPMEFAKRHGRRSSSFSEYILPVWGRLPNLRIILNTNVTRIIFKGDRAVGVVVECNSAHGLNASIQANKEIIISAGALGSPLLLQRSGVGPRNVLLSGNIPIVKELPVGKNYQNHVWIPFGVILKNRDALVDDERDLNPESWDYFNRFGDGPYSSTSGVFGQAFMVSPNARFQGEWDWPDLQPTMFHSVRSWRSFVSRIVGNVTMTKEEGPMAMLLFLSRPKSRGSLALNPEDPMKGLPIFDAGFLTDPKDLDAAVEGMKILVDICEKTPSYKKLGARLPLPNIPACGPFAFKSDEFWRCYVRYASNSGCHPAGTCRMGRDQHDPEAVVNNRLKVIGVTGLRVVDASIMPTLTNANTHAAVYGIAEKAAEMIINDWM